MNPKKVAVTLGIMFAVFHTLGVLLVQKGMLDYWGKVHLVSIQHTVQPFMLMPFVQGIVTAIVSGLVVGWVFATVWNWVDKKVK